MFLLLGAVLALVLGVIGDSTADDLVKLSELYKENLLSAEEYQRAKDQALAAGHRDVAAVLKEGMRAILAELTRQQKGPSSSDRVRELQESSPSLSDTLATTSMWLKNDRAKIALGPAADVSVARGANEDGTDPHLIVNGDLRITGDLLVSGQNVGAGGGGAGALDLGTNSTISFAADEEEAGLVFTATSGQQYKIHMEKVGGAVDLAAACAEGGGHLASGGATCWVRSNPLNQNMQECTGACAKLGLATQGADAWADAIQSSAYHLPLRDALCSSSYSGKTDPNSNSYWNRWSPSCEDAGSSKTFWVCQASQTKANFAVDARFTTEEGGGRNDKHARLCPCAVDAAAYAREAAVGTAQDNPGRTCATLLHAGRTESGAYWIDPNGGDPSDAVQTYCLQDVDAGGFTLIKRLYPGKPSGVSFASTSAFGAITAPDMDQSAWLSDATIQQVYASNGKQASGAEYLVMEDSGTNWVALMTNTAWITTEEMWIYQYRKPTEDGVWNSWSCGCCATDWSGPAMHWASSCNNGRVFSRSSGDAVAYGVALYHSNCPQGTAYLTSEQNCQTSGAGSRRAWFVR